MKEIVGGKKDNSIKQQIGDLYDVMKTENLGELEIKDKESYVFMKRKSKYQKVIMQPGIVSQAAPAPVEENTVTAVKAPEEIKGDTVKSPIIGTFYRSPSPTSASFVEEGDTVNAGKTLCIVEAMKVMNEIKADSRMKILKILVENGKPVISGQELFLIEKS